VTWSASEEFEPYIGELSSVRRFVSQAVDDLGRNGHDLVLVASELAANAVVHARTRFTVALSLDGRLLRIEVTDLNPHLPVPLIAAPEAESGRGLAVVEALSTDWGIADISGPGKVVWATLPWPSL
jgi:hypothetical protein